MTNGPDNPANSEHKRLIRRHYEHRIAPHRPHFEVLDWASAESQKARFDVLVKHVSLAGKSVLDVGCGLGDLLAFLKDRGIAAQYTGVDLLEKMVAAAKHNHPEAKFVLADLFRANPFEPGSFDVVFCSGAFNLNLGNNEAFLPAAIDTLLGLSREHLVFNLLHSRSRTHENTYFYYDPAKIRRILASRRCQAKIVDDYLHNDFTVFCRKAAEGQ